MRKRIISLALAGIIAAGTVVSVSAAIDTSAGVVFKADSGYVASTYTGTVNGVIPGDTVGKIKAALESDKGIHVMRESETLGEKAVLKSGDKLVLKAVDASDKSEFSVMFMGDANSDSKINIGDASAMLQKIAKWDRSIDEMASDVNGDGAVNLSDVAVILKSIAKWDVEFVKTPVIPGKYKMKEIGDIPCFGTPGNQGWVPLCLSDGIHYDLGVKFNVKENQFANQIAFLCPSWGDNKGTLTISIYKWDGDYNSSIAAMPIITNTFVDYEDNSTLILDLTDSSGKGLVEGEYVWRIHDGADAGDGTGVGIWYFEKLAPAESTGIKTFLNNKEFNIGPVANIFFTIAE